MTADRNAMDFQFGPVGGVPVMHTTQAGRTTAIAVALLAMVAMVPAAAQSLDPESAFRGRRLAETNCAPCHAIAQIDESEHPDAPPFRHMANRRPLETLPADMLGDLFLRHAVMPQFEPDERQVNDIVTYMKSIQE